MNQYSIIPMTQSDAHTIASWQYNGEYALYDHNETHEVEFMDGTHYACLDSAGTLMGYFCFGADAQIPTVELSPYKGDFLDIGLGLRPDLCGKGIGLAFMRHGLDFASTVFGTRYFRLSVAAFNNRAIKVYERAGFHKTQMVINRYSQIKFYIMTLTAE